MFSLFIVTTEDGWVNIVNELEVFLQSDIWLNFDIC